jgi:endonuclease-3
MVNRRNNVEDILDGLERIVCGGPLKYPELMSVRIAREYRADPFLILISCLLSLRTRDIISYAVSKKLFAIASTPQALIALPLSQLESIIYPTGFYHKKAETLQSVSHALLDRFNGKVPKTSEELLSLPGVGRKTANLVLAEAFDIPAICVDTHVHRLANTLGLVSTKTPEATERELEKIIPKSRWIQAHRLLVMCGQNNCDISSLLKKNGHD